MNIRLLILSALLLLAPVPTAAPAVAIAPAEAEQLRLIDLTDDFAAFYDRTATLDRDARIRAFYAQMAPLIPGFYESIRQVAPATDPDRYLIAALADYPTNRHDIDLTRQRFAALFGPARRSFEAAFGSLPGTPPIYLVHSLGTMDGGTRDLADGSHLVFGADMIARLHLRHDMQPFFHHELFHVLHARRFTGCEQIWCGLWEEGLAVYVAHVLNPRATDEELLLTQPGPLRPAVEAHRQEAICATRSRLDSTNSADRRAFFSSGRLSETLPPRFGYYVGYLVAQEIGRTHSLRQLAVMTQDQARPLVDRALARLAQCPST